MQPCELVGTNQNDEEDDEYEYKEPPSYVATTYKEWIQHSDIEEIVITNKEKCKGYLKMTGRPWRKLHDNSLTEWKEVETLSGYIEEYKHPPLFYMANTGIITMKQYEDMVITYTCKITNQCIVNSQYTVLNVSEKANYELDESKYRCNDFANVTYNEPKIRLDVLKTCFKKKLEFYDFKYYEYAISNSEKTESVPFVLLNAKEFTVKAVDDAIPSNKIWNWSRFMWRSLPVMRPTNLAMVDAILSSLISEPVKAEFKQIAYTLLVKPATELTVFYDSGSTKSGGGLLSVWLKDMLYIVSNGHGLFVYSSKYFEDKSEFDKSKVRCVCIDTCVPSVDKQIAHFKKLGVKTFTVRETWGTDKHMYDIVNFRKYQKDHRDEIVTVCQCPSNNAKYFDEEIFSQNDMMAMDFIQWCCCTEVV